MITVIGGTKGGTGKTTICTNLAVINSRLGHKTLLVDADEQGSSTDWADEREALFLSTDTSTPNFPTISLSGKNIYQQILKMKDDYEDIFVDSGGRDTINQRSALTVADCYLVPFKPRSFDIWTLTKVKSIVDEVRVINPELRVIICINQADPRGNDNDEALKILSEIPEFQCASTFIGHRKAFSNAASQGLGVWELDGETKSKEEILAIHQMLFYYAGKA